MADDLVTEETGESSAAPLTQKERAGEGVTG
jgi:hypothetical protein